MLDSNSLDMHTTLYLISLSFLISCAVCDDGPPNCPQSWVDATGYGLGCLLYNSTEKMDFVSASQYCKDCYQNASLVEISGPEVGQYDKDSYKQLIVVFQQIDYIQMSLRILEAGVRIIKCGNFFIKIIVSSGGGIGGLEPLTLV